MGFHGFSHRDGGVGEDLHLPIRKPGFCSVLGPPAHGFVLYRERHAQQQRSPPLPHSPNYGGGSTRRTPHRGNDRIGVQDDPHIVYDITSRVMLLGFWLGMERVGVT